MQNRVSLSATRDRWVWIGSKDNSFSVAQLKDMFRKDRDTRRNQLMKWENWVPAKINLFIWRAEMGRILTRGALARRQVKLDNVLCALCETADEDHNHVLIGCGFAFGVWDAIGKWCKVDLIFAFDLLDVLLLHKHFDGNKWAKKIIRGIVMISCWAIWKERNKKIFEGHIPRVTEVVACIKTVSFLWLKCRSRFKSLDWKDWRVNPLYMM
ncbi:putative reverse transcriptase zinc-binding domain-containing protein [Helianthus annuus]|nr:putative reverse transcriptase zinc-binding domain-containing protein [Helianthus annuus]